MSILDNLICSKCGREMLNWRDGEIALIFQCHCGYQEMVYLKIGVVMNNE